MTRTKRAAKKKPSRKPLVKKRAVGAAKLTPKKKLAPKKKTVAKAKKKAARKVVPPRYWFVRAHARPEHSATLSDQLFALGATGLEERDTSTLERSPDSEKVMVVASFRGEAEAKAAAKSLSALFSPKAFVTVGDAWRDEWKKHFSPFELAYGVWVRPPWKKLSSREADGAKVLELEPGRAFGTGLHESTALVAQILSSRRREVEGAKVLDVGTGSGILALVALAFGAKTALGTDTDGDALEVARQNAARNSLAKYTRFEDTPLDRLDEGAFGVVVANIEADVLAGMATDLARRVARGGLLVLSGILQGRKEHVRAAFEALSSPKLALVESPTKGEWVALAYRA